MIIQQTPEWREARRGKITASEMYRVFSRSPAYRETLRAELRGEELKQFDTPALFHGRKHEPRAKALYELYKDTEVLPASFYIDKHYPFLGCSPDGFPDDGLTEIKCPKNIEEHLNHFITIPLKYELQMQTCMAVTDKPWCDFVSFFPDIEVRQQYFCVRVDRDTDLIETIYRKSRDFWKWVNDDSDDDSIPNLF